MADIERRTEELVTPILERLGFELYDVELLREEGQQILRVTIDKEGGVTSDDTTEVCRELSERVDNEKNFITTAYVLEVSSPGLTRALTRPKHFSKSIGKDVEFKLYKPVTYEEDGKKLSAREFIGVLKAYDPDTDSVTVGMDEREMTFSRSELASIHLWIDF